MAAAASPAPSVRNAHPEYSTLNAGVGSKRITCSVEMATYQVSRLIGLATSLEGKQQTQRNIDCTFGVMLPGRFFI